MAVHIDLIKTDNEGFLSKTQAGLEGNYFFTTSFSATAGVELWTPGNVRGVLGVRWLPAEYAFVRLRGLSGVNDIAFGGGFVKPITSKLSFEATADYYFSIDFAVRAGFRYQFGQ